MAPQHSVRDALLAMKAAVRNGDIPKAQVIGSGSSIPLTLSKQQVNLGSKIGGGQEGTVYSGLFDNKEVAIKQAKIGTSNDLDRFREELSILSEIRHPNVVQVVGASAMPPNFFMVFPYVKSKLETVVYSKQWSGSWDDVLRIGYQVANALECVHTHGYVHRDVKPSNIMLDDSGNAVLIDFGLAAAADKVQDEYARRQLLNPSGGFHKQLMVGTLQYMAPEILQKQPHSYKSDVYAWAVTVNEAATQIFPFSDCTTDNPKAHTILDAGYTASELTSAVVGQNLRPTLPEHYPQGFAELMCACWHVDPNLRPSMATVKQTLVELSLQLNGQCEKFEVDSFDSRLGRAPSSSSLASCSTQATAVCQGAVVQEFMGGIQLDKCLDSGIISTHVYDENVTQKSTPLSLTTSTPFNYIDILYDNNNNMDINYQPTITIGSFATAGRRGEDCMEDRHVVNKGGGYYFVGVFDGHRGSSTAEFCAENAERYLRTALRFQKSPREALFAMYMQLDEEYAQAMAMQSIDRFGAISYSGCTALSSVVTGRDLYVANAGDCRMVMCRGGKAVQITRDHTANCDTERSRVQQCGGIVRWMVDGWRVGAAGMQVTRSIGDHDLKSDGVTAVPEIDHVILDIDDEFLVIASDGAWDKLDNQEVIGLVHDTVKQPDMSAKRIAIEALQRGSRDNITVIVMFLKSVQTLEQTFVEGQHKYVWTPTAYGSRQIVQSNAYQARDEVQDTY